TVEAGLPEHPAGRVGLLVLTAAALAAWVVSLRRSITDVRLLAALLLGTGLVGAWLNVLSPAGPGFLLAYMAMAGIGLRLPRRAAVLAGVVVLAAVGLAQATTSTHPPASFPDTALGAGFLFGAPAFAGVSRDANEQARRRLAQAQARAAGHPVTYEVAGEPRPIPAETGLAMYRAVQEALTNATKHGGAGSTVDVRVRWTPAELSAEVVNAIGQREATSLPSGGYG